MMVKHKQIRALIVDDEIEAREGLCALLEMDDEIEIAGVCENGLEAIVEVERLQPELLLLDIQMPEINGFEVLKSLASENLPAVIFVTAYDAYALKAFEVHAIDYLLKPFTKPRFFKALEHAKSIIRQSERVKDGGDVLKMLESYQPNDQSSKLLSATSSIDQQKLIVKSAGKIQFIPHNEINWLQADDVYVHVHTSEKKHLVRATLKQMIERLPSARFLRVHKSSIVNIDMIKEIEPLFNNEFMITLLDGSTIKVSRTYSSDIRVLLK